MFVVHVVVQSFWDDLVSFYPQSTPFPRATLPCALCVHLQSRANAAYELWHDKRERDKTEMPALSKQLHIDFPAEKPPNIGDWYLVPGQWAADMHTHLRSNDQVSLPKFLNTETLLCKEHGKLRFNPVPRKFEPHPSRPAPYDLPGTDIGSLGLMGSQAWDQLCRYKEYFLDEHKRMPAIKMHVKKSQTTTSAQTNRRASEQPHSKRTRNSSLPCCVLDPGVLHDFSDWNTVLVTTDPPPCPDCVMARIQEEEAARIGWEVGQLQIKVMVAGQQLPDAPIDAAASSSSASSRPKRSTRTKPKEPELIADFTPEPMAITSRSTLMDLKLQAMQHSSIVPAQQEMFIKGRQIIGDDLTLAQLQVPATAKIYVRVNLDGDADFPFAEVDPASERRKRPARPEAGFSGTALSSGMPRARAASAPATAAAAASGSCAESAASPPPAAASAVSPPPPSSSSPVAAAAPTKTWTCATCTFANEKLAALACDMCSQPRNK